MDALMVFLYVVVVLVALLLIGLILIQHSKGGGGLGATFGGVGESVFGARASNHLTKLTVIMTSLFFVLILVLAVISGHRDKDALGLKKKNAAAAAVAGKPEAAATPVKATVPAASPTAPAAAPAAQK